ncbi:septum formation initiator family protein [Streptomyces sp. LE64]|uniref:septum formation initiator family protein n=1 Tax=Streptomyces sp. LE64 TaxID=3448653 RepID=UPI0040437168
MTRGPELRGRAARLARLLPAGPSRAARTPFVLLMTLLLGGGLITLLLLNSSLNEGSFRLSELKRETTELTDEEQALQRDVDAHSEPGALRERARKLGMVPGGNPAFLEPDGTVRGVPGEPGGVSPNAGRDPDPTTTGSAAPAPAPGASANPAAPTGTPAPSAPTGTPAPSAPTGTPAPSAPAGAPPGTAPAASPSDPTASPAPSGPDPTTSGR